MTEMTCHKEMVAQNLREGLSWMRLLYELAFLENPLYEQWRLVGMKQDRGIDFEDNKLLIEDDFAMRSHVLYLRLSMKLNGD